MGQRSGFSSRPLSKKLSAIPARAQRHQPIKTITHFLFRINPQMMKKSCGQVLRSVGAVSGIGGTAIRTTQYPASFDFSSRQHQGVTLRPVIPAGIVDAVAGVLTEARR